METFNNLPVYEAYFDKDGLLIDTIALVSRPANKHEFVAMDEGELARFSVVDEDKRIIFGLVMGAGQLIYRRTIDRGEFYVHFSAKAIEDMLLGFMSNLRTTHVKATHNGEYVDGVILLQSFLKDTERGINPAGYDDVGDGSWFAAYKVLNDDVWDAIKTGDFKGFSIEGIYGVMPADDYKNMLDELDEMATDLNTII